MMPCNGDADVEAFAKIPGRSGDYDLSHRKRRGKNRDKKMKATIDFLRNSDGKVDDLDDDQVKLLAKVPGLSLPEFEFTPEKNQKR
jgi:hypothetical protein